MTFSSPYKPQQTLPITKTEKFNDLLHIIFALRLKYIPVSIKRRKEPLGFSTDFV